MAQVKFEELTRNDSEAKFQELITGLVEKSKTEDCRDLVGTVKFMAETLQLDMVIGTGGSHIYIHRKSQFINGKNSSEDNIRWAIITD